MNNQNQRVLMYLLQHERITQLEALGQLGVMRLASRINDLRAAGHHIITEMVTVKNRHGEVCRVAEYTIRQRAVA